MAEHPEDQAISFQRDVAVKGLDPISLQPLRPPCAAALCPGLLPSRSIVVVPHLRCAPEPYAELFRIVGMHHSVNVANTFLRAHLARVLRLFGVFNVGVLIAITPTLLGSSRLIPEIS